jgi:hypothetical protein
MADAEDDPNWRDGYSTGSGLKLKNRRVEVFYNKRTDEWWLRYKRLVDGKVKRQQIRLSGEALSATFHCVKKISEST